MHHVSLIPGPKPIPENPRLSTLRLPNPSSCRQFKTSSPAALFWDHLNRFVGFRFLARDLNRSGAFKFGCTHFRILAPTTQFPLVSNNYSLCSLAYRLTELCTAFHGLGLNFSWLNALLPASLEVYRLTCNNSVFSRLFAKVHWRRILSQERRIINCGFEWIDIRRFKLFDFIFTLFLTLDIFHIFLGWLHLYFLLKMWSCEYVSRSTFRQNTSLSYLLRPSATHRGHDKLWGTTMGTEPKMRAQEATASSIKTFPLARMFGVIYIKVCWVFIVFTVLGKPKTSMTWP